MHQPLGKVTERSLVMSPYTIGASVGNATQTILRVTYAKAPVQIFSARTRRPKRTVTSSVGLDHAKP